ncbi:MAG: NAD(P)-dependent oxidoreductase [Clostridiales bacterium]|nr:NAD(P)-dependent oxidoreductase [Clostridiales bacterium]
MMKKVLVLGGTGFLGYYTVKELLGHGYDVVSISLPPMPTEDLFDGLGVENHLFNISDKTDEELLEHLQGVYAVIYAIGADERIVPDAPAFTFFYENNVLPTQRMVRLSRKAGVESFVIFGSYFSEFAERWPEMNLTKMGYPATRLLQEQIGFAEGEGKMQVTSLRLPYIFGTMPGRMPLWKMFTDQIKGQPVFPSLPGGTAMVTAKQVAQAAYGAMVKGEHRMTYAIGGINMKYQEFYQMMVDALGQNETTQVPVLPLETLLPNFEALDAEAKKAGKEHGIHLAVGARMNSRDLYIDPKVTMEQLGYKEDDVVGAIKETLKFIVEEG